MSFPRLTFPLVVDFGSNEYWINCIVKPIGSGVLFFVDTGAIRSLFSHMIKRLYHADLSAGAYHL